MLSREIAAHLQQVITQIKLAKESLLQAVVSAEFNPGFAPSVPASGLRPASSNELEELHLKLKELRAFENGLIEFLINETACAYIVSLVMRDEGSGIEKKLFAVSREFPQVIVKGTEVYELRGVSSEVGDHAKTRMISLVEKHFTPPVARRKLDIDGSSWSNLGETVSFTAFSTYDAALDWSQSPKSEQIKRISAH